MFKQSSEALTGGIQGNEVFLKIAALKRIKLPGDHSHKKDYFFINIY